MKKRRMCNVSMLIYKGLNRAQRQLKIKNVKLVLSTPE
jgi:hypothetical protein